DIALFEQYEEELSKTCRFGKVYGFDHKYAKQHGNIADEIYNEIVSKGLEQAYKKYSEEKHKPTEKEENTMSSGGFDISAFISQKEQLKQIDIDLLIPYHNHKFKLYTGERLEDMVNSIKANGVLTPIIVRPAPNDEGKYEILAGHNRCNAAKQAGLQTVPGIIKEGLSNEDVEMYVVETNTMQRGFGDLSVSEQAAVIAMRHSRMFDPAKRAEIARELTDLDNTDGEDTEKKSKLAITGEEYSLSKNTVARLVRVNALLESCDKFTFAVNSKKDLSVRAAVELSYIPKTALEVIFEKYKIYVLEDNVRQLSVSISMDTAKWLREVFTDFRGTKEQAQKMLDKENVEKTRKEIDSITAKPIKISIPSDTFRKYFNEETKPDEAAYIIDKALQMYFSQKSTPTEEKSDNVSIEQLDLSDKALKALKIQHINTVAELTELMNDRSTAENILGIKVVEEILEVLEWEED
ncbi:MAG: ParB/RepB/Spo0J family partition protein, partial [Oscillospiraceae bacterium]|nr:ParB/RepB/Spo0J family partition protein [Oscillospiraceae bacterium]